jgi:hypothetical protein
MPPQNMRISAEQLAYWYLRLNGFLTIPNFVVHPEHGRSQETDVDVLAVRFPFRAELRTMRDDDLFDRVRAQSFIALAEVKTNICGLNGPWTNPDRQNMPKVLRALGAFPAPEVEMVSAALYERGVYESQLYHVSLLCFGKLANPDVQRDYPRVPQITWGKALSFIFHRFNAYRRHKESHGQWDEQGRALWDASQRSNELQLFLDSVVVSG